MGTEEDGVDEAGRATEPPLIVAPPGLEIDPEVKARDAVTENEVMSEDATTSNGTVSHHNGAWDGAGLAALGVSRVLPPTRVSWGAPSQLLMMLRGMRSPVLNSLLPALTYFLPVLNVPSAVCV